MAIGGNNAVVRAHRADYGIVISGFVLVAIGLVVMYSISPIQSQKLLGNVSQNFYFYNHLKIVCLGLVAWVVASKIDYHKWRDWAPRLMAVALLALVVLLIPGLSFAKNGATRWLKLGPASFQPAELAKLALVIYLARWLSEPDRALDSPWSGVIPFGLMLGLLSIIVVIFQRDMGTMMVMAAAAVGMLFVAGVRLRHLAALLATAAAGLWLMIIAFPHRVARLLTFLNPDKNSSNLGYQIQQALIAVGSGGVLGVGLGRSIQVYGYLPEAPNDSIFAIIAEEFGLIGAIGLLALFGFLVYRAFRIARSAPDSLSRLLAVGIGLWIMFQVIINIGAMLSLIPLTGIPLPFISYGGSSLVVTMFALGILVNISKYTLKEVTVDENSRVRGRNGRAYLAGSSRRRLA